MFDPANAGFLLGLATNFARSAEWISSLFLSFHNGYPAWLRGNKTRFSGRVIKSSTFGGGLAVMISISLAICRQYEVSGRSFTSCPKGFSISLPIVRSPMIIYAATPGIVSHVPSKNLISVPRLGLPIDAGIVVQ